MLTVDAIAEPVRRKRRMPGGRVAAPVVLLCAVVAGPPGCSPPCPESLYELSEPEPRVRLPLDESPHCDGGEWWYYTGLLVNREGDRFGFQAVTFHVSPGLYPLTAQGAWFVLPADVLVSHVALTDLAADRFDHAQVVVWQPVDPGEGGFDLTSPLLRLTGMEGTDRIQARLPDRGIELNLDLSPTLPPVVHAGTGYAPFGAKGQTFYYSRPAMVVAGELIRHGVAAPVEGEAWFDRQWGRDIRNPFLPWDWFSVRLDGGARLMLFLFRDGDPPVRYGTLMMADGTTTFIPGEDIRIDELDFWTSPRTGGRYPVHWRVVLDNLDLDLDIDRLRDDQEIDARASTRNVYWEGLCSVIGRFAGEPATGHAYVELTNYVR